jgi:hypothetical protein
VLHAAFPGVNVLGLALAHNGNDDAGSRSPGDFIRRVGDAYRASGRKLPIMDNVGLHPYPDVNTDTPDKGYVWPNVGIPNLDRGEQAFWDAFNGTGQPTFQDGAARTAEGLGGFVKWILDEAGWQTNTQNLAGYSGTENVPPVDESTQAQYHAAIVRRLACDPHVAALLFFNWIDESDRDRFQTGSVRADGSMKPSADAVKGAIAGGCAGAQAMWTHSTAVDGARVDWTLKAGRVAFLYADEDATYTLTAKPKRGSHPKTVTVKGSVRAHLVLGVKVPGIATKQAAAADTITVTFAAAANPARTSTFSH